MKRDLQNSPELQSERMHNYVTALQNLVYAWELILNKNQKRGPYDREFVIRLQHNVEPDAVDRNGYRAGEAEIRGKLIKGNPDAQMQSFLSTLNNALEANDTVHAQIDQPEFSELYSYIYFGKGTPKNHWKSMRERAAHPVDLAAFTHMEFERIHPFNDGNGRIGRLLMNGILRRYGYPVVVIPKDERELYLSQVMIGDQGFEAGMKRSDAYRPFGSYMGTKIERTLEGLMGTNIAETGEFPTAPKSEYHP